MEIARLQAALAASEARAKAAENELAQVRAVVSTSEAMIKHLRLEIARLRRDQYGALLQNSDVGRFTSQIHAVRRVA